MSFSASRLEHTPARAPELVDEAAMHNEVRFLSLDLVCGRHVHAGMCTYLLDYGWSEPEYLWFLRHNLREHIVMGHDYYASCEHLVVEPGRRAPAGDVFGYYAIARSYYGRYNLPVMHTETHMAGDQESVRWLRKEQSHKRTTA